MKRTALSFDRTPRFDLTGPGAAGRPSGRMSPGAGRWPTPPPLFRPEGLPAAPGRLIAGMRIGDPGCGLPSSSPQKVCVHTGASDRRLAEKAEVGMTGAGGVAPTYGFALEPPRNLDAGCGCPWVRNKGGGMRRRRMPGDIRTQGHPHPAPCGGQQQAQSLPSVMERNREGPRGRGPPIETPQAGHPAGAGLTAAASAASRRISRGSAGAGSAGPRTGRRRPCRRS